MLRKVSAMQKHEKPTEHKAPKIKHEWRNGRHKKHRKKHLSLILLLLGEPTVPILISSARLVYWTSNSWWFHEMTQLLDRSLSTLNARSSSSRALRNSSLVYTLLLVSNAWCLHRLIEPFPSPLFCSFIFISPYPPSNFSDFTFPLCGGGPP